MIPIIEKVKLFKFFSGYTWFCRPHSFILQKVYNTHASIDFGLVIFRPEDSTAGTGIRFMYDNYLVACRFKMQCLLIFSVVFNLNHKKDKVL